MAGGVAAAGLERVIVAGETLYVALYSDEIDILADSGTEVDDPGYERQSCDSWVTTVDTAYVERANNAAIVFPAWEGPSEKSAVVSWALRTAAVGGSLIAGGLIRNIAGEAEAITINPGDVIRFDVGGLAVRMTVG